MGKFQFSKSKLKAKHKSAEQISQQVFFILIGLAVLVFGLFFLVGYDMPFEENPDFNAPLFTDVLIVLMWLFLIGGVGLAVYSMIRDYRGAKSEAVVNGVPVRRIFRITWLGTLAILVLSFLLGSSDSMLINGENYADWIWLKLSDMFVITLLIFFLVTTSMDVDKGLLRQLPSPEPQNKERQESVVDKENLLAIRLTAGDTLLVNDRPMKVAQLKDEVIRLVHRLGKKHLISVESDRDADYNLYFQMQNELMEAYSQLRNETSQKKYHMNYAQLGNDQKEEVRKLCPQRITESYANATTYSDKRIDANAEEKKGDEAKMEEAEAKTEQKGGKP